MHGVGTCVRGICATGVAACLLLLQIGVAAADMRFLVASDFTLGGGPYDRLTDLVVDGAGNAYVAGVIGSYNFPGVDSAATTNAGMSLRFVAKIPPLARTPSWVAVVGAPTASIAGATSTQFARDEAMGLALDASGNAYAVAYDSAKDYPVAGGQYWWSTGQKYVYRINAAGQVTRLSKALDPAINRIGAVAVDGAGAIYLTGSARDGLATSMSAPYPTSAVAAGCIAPYLMKVDPTGQAVVYATYLGGATQGQACTPAPAHSVIDPTGFALAVDTGGNAFVTGQAEPAFPATPGAVDFGTKTPGPFYVSGNIVATASHAFVTKVSASGTAILFNARLGGARPDRGTSLVVDASGSVIVTGKTSSTGFPTAGAGPQQGFPAVTADCMLRTPETGFVSKLSADGKQLLFSNFVPLAGGQLDDCGGQFGTLTFEPAKVALDAAGNLYVAGYTVASNVDVPYTFGAIIPAPVGPQAEVGNQLLQVISADGQRLLYSSPLVPVGVRGLAVDRWQTAIIASGAGLERIAPGMMPVEMTAPAAPACAGRSLTLSASVAGSNDLGTVDFMVDGASLGSAPIANGAAMKAVTLAAGIRRLKATYHGPGPFDAYSSLELFLGVDQAGVCP